MVKKAYTKGKCCPKAITIFIGIICVLLGITTVLFFTNKKFAMTIKDIVQIQENEETKNAKNNENEKNVDESENKAEIKENTKEEVVVEEDKTKNEKKTIVNVGDTITVDYIGKLKDGTVFDTSIESVAKENNKYQEGRNYKDGLSFKAGAGQMIKGFDKGVIGMKIGQTKTMNIPALEGYGERSEQNVQLVDVKQLPPKPNNESYNVGDILNARGSNVTIVEIEGTGVKIDFNHALAGKDLIFEVKLRNIK